MATWSTFPLLTPPSCTHGQFTNDQRLPCRANGGLRAFTAIKTSGLFKEHGSGLPRAQNVGCLCVFAVRNTLSGLKTHRREQLSPASVTVFVSASRFWILGLGWLVAQNKQPCELEVWKLSVYDDLNL